MHPDYEEIQNHDKRAISSAGSEHLVYTEGVGGSNPSSPTRNFNRNVGVFFMSCFIKSYKLFSFYLTTKIIHRYSPLGYFLIRKKILAKWKSLKTKNFLCQCIIYLNLLTSDIFSNIKNIINYPLNR